MIPGFRTITLWASLKNLSRSLEEALEKRSYKGDPMDLDRDYKVCINCIHLPYDKIWSSLANHKSGTCYLDCKKGVRTHDLSKQAENCYYFKLNL